MSGQVEDMMRHSVDYLDLFSTVVVSWQWLLQAAVAKEKLVAGAGHDAPFYEGKLCAADYWIKTELPRIEHLALLCRSGEDSYVRMNPAWF
jgi:butyryl-CoA dehydrogenase